VRWMSFFRAQDFSLFVQGASRAPKNSKQPMQGKRSPLKVTCEGRSVKERGGTFRFGVAKRFKKTAAATISAI